MADQLEEHHNNFSLLRKSGHFYFGLTHTLALVDITLN